MTTLPLHADIHGNHAAAEAVLADIDAYSPDRVLCLGDPRAGWVLLQVDEDGAFTSSLHRVIYDVTTTAAAIRGTDGLPDRYAADIETGGKSA
jgi:hypothetical protein